MFLEDLQAPLEALLFASGEPVSEEKLISILQIDKEDLTELLAMLSYTLKERKSALFLRKVAGGWQLATKEDYYEYIAKLAQITERKLSAAAMETLSIIAFKQPITKQEIEKIRGVHSEKILSTLIEMELITEVGRKSVVGRPVLYGTTNMFLKCFGLNDLKEMPVLPEIQNDADFAEQLSLLDDIDNTDKN